MDRGTPAPWLGSQEADQMDPYLSIDDLVSLGGGRFVPRLALADALFRTGQLVALGGGQSIARAALADALIRAGHLTPAGQIAA